jgi:hypothetical protein
MTILAMREAWWSGFFCFSGARIPEEEDFNHPLRWRKMRKMRN